MLRVVRRRLPPVQTDRIADTIASVTGFASSVIAQFNSIVASIKTAFSIDWGSVGAGIIGGIAGGVMAAAGGLAQQVADAARAALDRLLAASQRHHGQSKRLRAQDIDGQASDQGGPQAGQASLQRSPRKDQNRDDVRVRPTRWGCFQHSGLEHRRQQHPKD